MMTGERYHHSTPTVHVPPWTLCDDPTAGISFSFSRKANANFNGDDYSLFLHNDAITELQRYLPSNDNPNDYDDVLGGELDLPVDAYSCDRFRMYEFKVRKCVRGRSHDWTECPYAHPGEKARRRDPRKYHYSGTACPDFRKGNCKKGDGCEFAHGVFECWLHPARYRTQPCTDGQNCRRRVCFFAHTADQLRVLSPSNPGSAESFDGSPRRLVFEDSCSPTESRPMSPMANSMSRSLGSNSVSEMVASLRQLQVNKVKSMPTSWGLQMGSSGFGSPRLSMVRAGFCSLPSTPTRVLNRPGIGYLDPWDKCEEESVMERVESGRDLRAQMFEKLSKENPLNRVDPNPYDASNPDVGWVSELVK